MSTPQPPPSEKKADDDPNVRVDEKSGVEGKGKSDVEVKKKLPQLGALEDDDEFEVSQPSNSP